VLGAGFTGLAAARRLAEHRPGDRIVVLDASRVGAGSSGRNSGFVLDAGHWHEGLDVADNARLLRLQRAGRSYLREIVLRHAIDCSWSEVGCFRGAVEPAGLRRLETLCRGLDALGETYERIDPEGLARRIGTPYYTASIRTPGTVLVQPAALVRGLARSLPGNVELLEESPVRAVEASGSGHRLVGDGGSLRAQALLLASNGFTPALGFLRHRIFPLLTFASLTRPLEPEERQHVGEDQEWGLVPEERMGTTLRRTRDQRILVRNTVRYVADLVHRERERARVAEFHRRSLRARFPALEGIELAFTWAGVLGMTRNGAPFFGRVRDGIFASCAYNGVGVSLGTIAGVLLADLAVGRRSELLADLEALPAPSWIPGEPWLGIGVRSALGWRRGRAGREC
jgi:glycine/D-amino acid oxidase-like deaminating enzyme